MRSPKPPWLWLVSKEWRELTASRAWWFLLLAMGPLVGISFISAARTYAEVSGLNGTAAGVGEALSPLIGVLAPTFSACELAAVFLLPFVAIRLVAADRQSGALKLEMQQGLSSGARMSAKAMVLLIAWLLALVPPAGAILLWKMNGGAVYAPELFTLAAGHVLNAGLTIAIAAAAASIAGHPSTAAILTLGVTVGTWIINFVGAVQGGWWDRVAGYTPAAMVAGFQHGLLRLDTVLVTLILVISGVALGAIWIRLGVALSRRVLESLGLASLAALGIFLSTFASWSWDASENRYNSFPEADEQALRQIHDPLRIEVHLAPEDPRRVDLEQHALSKLRRVMPRVRIEYQSNTSIGLFEQSSAGYGEIWYSLGERRTMSRVTSAEGVLESIYSLAGIAPARGEDEDAYRGHPLAVAPKSAAAIFYFLWPAAILVSFFFARYYHW